MSVNGTTTAATTPALTTHQPNERLLAFVAADGPSASKQTVTVSGGGLTWTLVARSNTQAGTSEVWSAIAPAVLTSATFTSTEASGGYHQSVTLVALLGASGTGAVATGAGATGAPTVSLTTTRANSLVFGVGNDWDGSTARTVGANQTMVTQWLDTSVGDTFWVQSTAQLIGPIGTVVTMNDTAPTNHRWNFTAVEVLAG